MIGQPLQLQSDADDRLGAKRRFDVTQGLHDGGVCPSVPDSGIACDGFGNGHTPRGRCGDERLFGSPVLITELNLQMENGFPGALKSEMAGLDHPRMDRSYRDLVDPRAFDSEERIGLFGAGRRLEIRMASERFQPRMSVGTNGEVLEDLPFEGLRRRQIRCQRREFGGVHPRFSQSDFAVFVFGENGDKLRFIEGEQRDETSLVRAGRKHCAPKRILFQIRNRVAQNRYEIVGPQNFRGSGYAER